MGGIGLGEIEMRATNVDFLSNQGAKEVAKARTADPHPGLQDNCSAGT
jgi:hypothetical protein